MKKIILYVLAIIGVIAVLSIVGVALVAVKSSSTGDMANSFGGQSFSDSAPMAVSAPMMAELGISAKSRSVTSPIAVSQVTERKITKNGSLELIVEKAEDTALAIQNIAEQAGGFVGHSQISEVSDGVKTGSITIRLPADKFNQAMIDIKQLANKVEQENVDAQDVTEQYTDLDARLKNARATESQYLEILKKAGKVQDLLDVQQKIGEVRGEIEQIQGQLKYLNSQIDMSTINVSLTAQADVQVFGIVWRPLTVIKQAFRNLLNSLTGYVDAIVGLIFLLPVIALWLATIGVIIWVLWKIGRWLKSKLVNKDKKLKPKK
ncbi:MAG: DUF4349 domain-containing protein [Candidatus Vogelbacteria bacterium]|nr:DUF4349 domain-containing protein [Candidatus Vogelbacteria bacterium]